MAVSIRKIAKNLSRYPGLKRFLKFAYQLMMFAFHFHRNRYLGKFNLERISGDEGGFFGYYDKSPESPDGKHIIFHAFEGNENFVSNEEVKIVLVDVASGSRENIFKTSAFNLQIGSRLQWIDNDRFVFNIYDLSTSDFISLIYTISSGQFRKIMFSVFDVHMSKFISINFNNLSEVGSEYGYNSNGPKPVNQKPYIKIGDFNEGSAYEIVNLEMIAEIAPHIFKNGEAHHFNHIMFAPGGNKFIFILRWNSDEGRKEFLFLYDLNSGNLCILNSEMTSHCCWIDEITILGFMSHLGQNGFYYLDVNSGKFSRLAINENLGDGHPSVRSEMILVDSYPDESRMQQLMILSKGKVLHVGSFYSRLSYHEADRCDLHPRFNQKGDAIYIDSNHDRKRHLYRVKLKSND